MKRLLFIVTLLTFIVTGGNVVSTNKEQAPLLMLQSSELLFKNALNMAIGSYKGQERFYVFHSNSVAIYDEQRSVVSVVYTAGDFYPIDPVVNSEGNVYFINPATDEIGFLTPTGQWGGSFKVQERPYSLGMLSNGNLVIASPSGGKLIHVYDTSGRKLRSFGDVKNFDATNDAQNLFLNRGKVVVDSSDNVYLVFKYAPTPTVLKFSKKGKLISEFAIEGYSINLQVEMARKYLSSKRLSEVGGIVITNSAAIDPSTGHLWICMNGSSRAGIIYEYSSKGRKLREYSLIVVPPLIPSTVFTSVTDILVRGNTIYIPGGGGILSASPDEALARGGFVFPQETCPQEQSWGGCQANCPQGSCPASINCKAILQNQIQQGLRVIGSSCYSLGPGQSVPNNPAKPNGGCVASVTTCNTSTGEQATHTTNQDCNAVKYKCSGADCVVDCSGSFTTSNCNNTCTGGGGGEGGGGGGIVCIPCLDGGTDPITCECITPILIDVSGNGFDLTNAAAGVNFDLNPDGIAEHISWTAANSDDAWLTLDRNGNGRIDDGRELFGNFTPQPSTGRPDGFLALAQYDRLASGGNGDGLIDNRDTIFSSLRLWQDTNHNGLSEPGELRTLHSLGVYALDLDHKISKRRDQHGNWFRYRAKAYDARGAHVGRWAWDVILLKQ